MLELTNSSRGDLIGFEIFLIGDRRSAMSSDARYLCGTSVPRIEQEMRDLSEMFGFRGLFVSVNLLSTM